MTCKNPGMKSRDTAMRGRGGHELWISRVSGEGGKKGGIGVRGGWIR